MRVRSAQILLWVCEECEATWTSQAEVNVCKFEDYGTLMAGMDAVVYGRNWSHSEKFLIAADPAPTGCESILSIQLRIICAVQPECSV
ncbi:hypothetical protein L6203_25835, partial [Pseudomonas syringae pv. syringae]|nr:hypothetical protein [Pseudomonas syringae pv. syringae]